MAKNTVRGTALYCGIDVNFEQMKEHLVMGADVVQDDLVLLG